jgi:hypothetical protein
MGTSERIHNPKYARIMEETIIMLSSQGERRNLLDAIDVVMGEILAWFLFNVKLKFNIIFNLTFIENLYMG